MAYSDDDNNNNTDDNNQPQQHPPQQQQQQQQEALVEEACVLEMGGQGAELGGLQRRVDWHRRYVMQYGRCLLERPIRMGPWHEGITLSFDLHDEADGLRLFSSTGPIRFTGTTIAGITAMKLTGKRRRVTTPFSAASR